MPIIAQQAIPESLLGWLTTSAVTVLALGVLSFVRGWIVPGSALAKAEQRAERAEERLRQVAEEDRVTLIPALTRATDVLAHYVAEKADPTPPPPTRPPRSSR